MSGSGRLTRPTHRQEDRIDTLWPRTAPPTVKVALLGIYLMVVLLVLNIATVVAISPNGGIVGEDVLIGAGFLAIAIGIARRAAWSRYVGIGVAALFAIGALSQFQRGVPGLVVGVGVVQLVVLVGVVVVLVLRPTGEWYRGEV